MTRPDVAAGSAVVVTGETTGETTREIIKGTIKEITRETTARPIEDGTMTDAIMTGRRDARHRHDGHHHAHHHRDDRRHAHHRRNLHHQLEKVEDVQVARAIR